LGLEITLTTVASNGGLLVLICITEPLIANKNPSYEIREPEILIAPDPCDRSNKRSASWASAMRDWAIFHLGADPGYWD